MDLGLEGRVALVSAGSKGLGRAIAEEFVAEGARVAICARGQEALDRTVGALRATAADGDRQVIGVRADVARTEDIERVVTETMRQLGPVEILVTNSGGPPAGRFDEVTSGQWDQAIDQLLTSVVTFVSLVLPGMRERRWGRILNITSLTAKQPLDGLILSNSIRGAVTALGRSLANEVAAEGITVNNLMPGFTRTERVEELAVHKAAEEGLRPADITAKWEQEIPMRRLGEPREFAALAAFLASDRASYITACSIAVDGGWIRSVI